MSQDGAGAARVDDGAGAAAAAAAAPRATATTSTGDTSGPPVAKARRPGLASRAGRRRAFPRTSGADRLRDARCGGGGGGGAGGGGGRPRRGSSHCVWPVATCWKYAYWSASDQSSCHSSPSQRNVAGGGGGGGGGGGAARVMAAGQSPSRDPRDESDA